MMESLDADIVKMHEITLGWLAEGHTEDFRIPVSGNDHLTLNLMPGTIEVVMPTKIVVDLALRAMIPEGMQQVLVRYNADPKKEFPIYKRLDAEGLKQVLDIRSETFDENDVKAHQIHASIMEKTAAFTQQAATTWYNAHHTLEKRVLPQDALGRLLADVQLNTQSLVRDRTLHKSGYAAVVCDLHSRMVKYAMLQKAVDVGVGWHRERQLPAAEQEFMKKCLEYDDVVLEKSFRLVQAIRNCVHHAAAGFELYYKEDPLKEEK